MHWLDISIVAVVVISTIIGIFRGFVKEVLTLLSWTIAIILAYNFYHLLVPYLEFISIPLIKMIVAGFIIFLSVLILLSLVNYILSKSMKLVGFDWFDKSLGAGFGFARAMLLLSLVAIVVSPNTDNSIDKTVATSDDNASWKKGSILYPKVEGVAFSLQKQLPKDWVQKVSNNLL
jgi:membrane protein required for colicin V production